MSSQRNFTSILNDFFDKIYVITLKQSRHRHDLLKETLKGINYDIFWGVDGSELNLDEIQSQGLYDSGLAKQEIPIGKDLTRGEIGCALSHIKIYKDILANNYQQVLILEDDLSLAEETSTDELIKALSELPDNWDLLYLGYLYNTDVMRWRIKMRIYIAYPILKLLGFDRYDPQKLRRKFPRPYSEHLDMSGYHFGTHAYAVTAAGAKKILERQTPISMASDNAIGTMCMENSLKAFKVKKRVFHQNRKLETTIKGRRRVE